MGKDSEVEGYPLPIDPVTGRAWWRANISLIHTLEGWRDYQGQKRMDALIPIIRWLIHGAQPAAAKP